jgi:hypothetical protein
MSARLLAGHVWGQDGEQGLRLLSGHTWEDGGEEAGPLYDDAGHVQHQLGQVHQTTSRTRPGQDGGQGLRLLSGHTWEDGGEEAGPLYDDAGHVQHQLGQVSQAASRTRLGQEPDTFIIYFIFLFFLLGGIQSTAPLCCSHVNLRRCDTVIPYQAISQIRTFDLILKFNECFRLFTESAEQTSCFKFKSATCCHEC